MALNRFNFTAASAAFSAYQKTGVPREAGVLRLIAWSDGSSGTATIRVAIRSPRKPDGEKTILIEEATATVGALRRGEDGASGQYLCAVVFTLSGTDKMDLMPYLESHKDDDGGPLEVFVGVSAFGTISEIDLIVGWDRNV